MLLNSRVRIFTSISVLGTMNTSEVTYLHFFNPHLNSNRSQIIELERFDDYYFVDNVIPDYVYILSAVYMAIIFTIGFVANISIFIIFGTSPMVSIYLHTIWLTGFLEFQILKKP